MGSISRVLDLKLRSVKSSENSQEEQTVGFLRLLVQFSINLKSFGGNGSEAVP